MKVLLLAVLISPLHSPLKNRVVAFNGVRRDVAASLFFPTVVDGFMAGKFATDTAVLLRFIRHQAGFASDVCANDRSNLPEAGRIYMKATCRAAALHQRKHSVFMR